MGSSTCNFLEIFCSCDFDDQNLLCALFLHNIMGEYLSMKMVESVLSFMGDLQLRAFLLFMRNQIEWKLDRKTTEANDEETSLWVKDEPGMAYKLQQ